MTRSLQANNAPSPLQIFAVPRTTVDGSDGDASSSSATSSDPLASIGAVFVNQLEGAYVAMQQNGTYSTSTAIQAAQSLAPYLAASVPYHMFVSSDVQTTADTSYARMLKYRSDLQVSLAPLLKNTEPEYELFGEYVDTKDASYLTEMRAAAANYRAAASSTALLVVPEDALSFQVGILNAMEEFAATLDAMTSHADDPFASTALLRGYDKAENDMLTSFNSLATYFRTKPQ